MYPWLLSVLLSGCNDASTWNAAEEFVCDMGVNNGLQDGQNCSVQGTSSPSLKGRTLAIYNDCYLMAYGYEAALADCLP